MTWQILFGETATTKIAAFFDSGEAAAVAGAGLRSSAGLQLTQLRLIEPHEKDYSKKLEPETRGVPRTALRSHLVLGTIGLILGALLWAALYAKGIPAVVSSPQLSAGAIIFFSLIGGLLLGGLITARPDHELVIQRVRSEVEGGRWSLVIHPMTPAQCDAVTDFLAESGVEMVRSV